MLGPTAAVRCNTCLSHGLDALLLDQPTKSMECSPGLEGTNLLLVLALEEQLDFRVGIGLSSIAM